MNKIKLILSILLLSVFTIACGPSLSSDVAKYSYSIGFKIGESMKAQKVELEMTQFEKGFNDILSNATDKKVSEKPNKSNMIGQQIGGNFKNDNLEVDKKAFFAGIDMAFNGKDASLSKEEMKKALDEITKKMMTKRKIVADKSLKEGADYLAKNKSKKGVITTKSGLQYKIIKRGKGRKPKAKQTVKVHYAGTLVNGTEFDSSYKRNQPAIFPVNGVIKGWIEGLQLMRTGSTYEFYIPGNLAYGPNGTPTIPGNSVLIFKVELLEIVKK